MLLRADRKAINDNGYQVIDNFCFFSQQEGNAAHSLVNSMKEELLGGISNFILGGGVAQSVRAPNSNYKIASAMSTLGVTRCCVLGKDTYANIATIELSGQERKLTTARLLTSLSRTRVSIVVSLGKTLDAYAHKTGLSNLPVVVA